MHVRYSVVVFAASVLDGFMIHRLREVHMNRYSGS